MTRKITTVAIYCGANARGENSETRTEAYIDGIWYTIARNRMTYNAEGKRTSLENLAGQVTTTAWDGWSVTYNGENRPVVWECVSTNSPTPNSSTPTLISMSYDRMGRRVTKNNSYKALFWGVPGGYWDVEQYEDLTEFAVAKSGGKDISQEQGGF